MRKLLMISVAIFLLSPANLFGQAPVEREAPPSRTSNLTLEQHHVIKEIIKDSKIESAPANILVGVGDTVPQSITLHPILEAVGAKLSQVKTHLFFVQNAKVFIVDPKDRRVIDIID